MTDNHGYETPQKGATEWHESLNKNFRYIDRDVEIRDIDAAKADYRPKSGAKFLATDTEDVYVGDGNQWLRLATSGENPSFDTVSTKTIVDRDSGNGYSVDELAGGSGSGSLKTPVDAIVTLEGGNPTAYRGDGTHLAQDNDAATVVQSALDAAESSKGRGNVRIGSGSYSLQSKIEVPSNITVSGAGIGATVFNCTGPNQEWIGKESRPYNIVIRDFTQDGNDAGARTGINITDNFHCRLTNLEVLNAGGRNGDSDSTPALRVSGGKRSRIDNCRVKRSSSVSIEAAIDAVGCEIVNCVVQDGVYNSGAAFTHGISIEKSENCRIEGCYVEQGDGFFSPALNVNNADYAVCADNTVKGADKGLINSNGPCRSNVYANNNFYDCDIAMEVKGGGSGAPTGTLLAGNVIDGSSIDGMRLGNEGDVDVRNNLFRNITTDNGFAIKVRSLDETPSIVGNVFRNCKFGAMKVESSGTRDPILVANNYFDKTTTTQSVGSPVVEIREPYGIATGNVLASTTENKVTAAIDPSSSPSFWTVSNNYILSSKRILQMNADGVVTDNVFDGSNNNFSNLVRAGSADTRFNRGIGGANIELNELDTDNGLTNSWTRSGTYTGDGTTGRGIALAMDPDHVFVQGSDGTIYDVHSQFGTGFQQTAPSGELSLSGTGIVVGDNGADADPNTNGETYALYAR